MQLKNQTFAIPTLKSALGVLTLLATTLVIGAPSAQAQPGGFQSNVTGGVVGSFVYGSTEGFGFNRPLTFSKLSPDFQKSLQAAGNAAAALAQDSLGALEASSICVSGNFPESPERQQFLEAIKAVQSNIADINKETTGMMPADGSVHLGSLDRASRGAKDLQKSLRFAAKATDALAKTAVTPEQKACIMSAYDALGKAVTGLEQLAPALNNAMKHAKMR